MTEKARKELVLLGLLLAALGGVVYVNYFRSSDGPTVSTRRAPEQPARSVAPQSKQNVSVTDVELDLLDDEPKSYSPAKRDPFRFPPKAPPPVKLPVRIVDQGPRPPPPVVDKGPAVETLVKYVGYTVSAAGAAVATLTVRTDTNSAAVPFVGVAGDVIEGRYRLQRIEPTGVEVVVLGPNGRRVRLPRS